MKAIINYLLVLSICFGFACTFNQNEGDDNNDKVHEKIEVEAFLNEGEKAYKAKNYAKAEKLYEKAIVLTEKHAYNSLLADTYNSMGILKYKTNKYDKSILFYKRASELYLAVGNKNFAGKTLRNLGQAYKKLTIYDDALVCLFKSLKLMDKEGQEKRISSAYNLIGLIQTELGDYESSVRYHKKALELRKSIDYRVGIAGSLQNIGLAYLENNNLEEALKFFNHSLIEKEKLSSKKYLASTYSSIGEAYSSKKEYELAEKYYLRAFEVRSEYKDNYGILVSSNKLGKLYLDNSKLSKAKKYLSIANELSKKYKSKYELAKNHKYFKTLSLSEKNYSDALMHSDAYMKISDEILNEKKAQSMIANRIKYEVDQINKEILLQKEKVATLTQHKTALMAGSTMTLVIAFLFYYLFQQKKKSEARVQQLLKDTHHRVKNNLQALSGMLSYQAFEMKSLPAKEVITEVENRMKAIMYIHKRLCKPREEALADISFKDYIFDLIQNLRITYGYADSKLKLIFDVDDVNIDVEKAVPLGLIINELVTNCFKYAFKDHPYPMLTIEVKKLNDHMLHLKVEDNGNGLPENFESKTDSSGMIILKDMVRDLKSHLMVKNENGASFELNISI